jgi:hypothetical protein
MPRGDRVKAAAIGRGLPARACRSNVGLST